MPGLIGVASTRGPDAAARQFTIARDRIGRHGGMSSTTVSTADGACLAGHFQLAFSEAPGSTTRAIVSPTVLFHGVLYNEQDLRREVPAGAAPLSLEALLAALYLRDAARFVERLEGEFCLAVVDPGQSLVVLATDAVGNYPLYWSNDANGLVFASDLSAVLAAVPAARRLDLRAVADYLTIGAVFEDKTLAAGATLLGPGTVLTYDRRANLSRQTRYLDLQTFFAPRASSQRDYFEAVEATFTRAVARAVATPRPVGLSLSGGLDSRAMLAAVGRRSVRLKTYTLGVEGCADQAIAARLSRIADTDHHYFPLSDAYLRDFLPNLSRMVSLTDGMYLSHGLAEMLAVQFLEGLGIEVLLRGHGGELAKAHLAWPLHTDSQVYAMRTVAELVPYLSARANYITGDLPLAELLTADAAAKAGNGARDSFAAVLRGTGLSPAQCCSFLYLNEFTRRFTVPSLEVLRTVVDVRMPFLDPSYLRALLGAPPEWRDSTQIHQRLTAAGLPRLLKVRNSNTGAPADAGPRVEFALDKVNTLLKRLNVKGYRHYHNFDGWMRRMLVQTVEAELLAPEARIGSFMQRSAVTRLIADTREGRADRSHLLQILLILELWQRENQIETAA